MQKWYENNRGRAVKLKTSLTVICIFIKIERWLFNFPAINKFNAKKNETGKSYVTQNLLFLIGANNISAYLSHTKLVN